MFVHTPTLAAPKVAARQLATQPQESSSNTVDVIVGGVIFVAIFCMFVMFLCWLHRRRKASRRYVPRQGITGGRLSGRVLLSGLGALIGGLNSGLNGSPERAVFGSGPSAAQRARAAQSAAAERDYRRHRSNAFGDYAAGDYRRGDDEMVRARRAKRNI